MLHRLRTFLLVLVGALWVACGVALPASALAGGVAVPDLGRVLVMLAATALIAVFSRFRFAFEHERSRLDVSLDAAFVVLAALLLPPAEAALVGLLGSLRANMRFSRAVMVLQSASAALSAGLGSMLVHELFDGAPSGRAVLAAALLASAVRALVALVGWIVANELQQPGAGLALLRNLPVGLIMVLEIVLPLVAVALAGPFLDIPAAALVVILCAQAFVYVVIRLLHDEHRHRREKVYLERTFSRYMPSNLADQLMQSSQRGRANPGLELGGEQREITVLFLDIRDFTAWAEQNEARQVIAELNTLLGALSQAILSTGGTLDKFTGDGLMAFWGAPAGQPDQAARAYNAVIRMFRTVRTVNEQRADIGEPPFAIGIGVHTGWAMVGNIGHTERLDYTAIGDTVNLAARLESATRQADCPLLISEAMFLRLPLEAQRSCARLDSITVKGRKQAVQAYTLKRFARRAPAAATGTDG